MRNTRLMSSNESLTTYVRVFQQFSTLEKNNIFDKCLHTGTYLYLKIYKRYKHEIESRF